MKQHGNLQVTAKHGLLMSVLLGGVTIGKTDVPSRTKYHDLPAWRLSNGRLEAIVVPALGGRLISFGFVGKSNILWTKTNTATETKQLKKKSGYVDWGGDMMWLAPMSGWQSMIGREWPPDQAWDTLEHSSHVEDNSVITTGPVSANGLQLSRKYSFEGNDLVIEQCVENHGDTARSVSIWNVTRVPWPTKVLIPRGKSGAGFEWLSPEKPESALVSSPDSLVGFKPVSGKKFKVGANPTWPAIAAVLPEGVLVEHASPSNGSYPDGIAGCSVELYSSSGPEGKFVELELLSPQHSIEAGASATHTIRWSLIANTDLQKPLETILQELAAETLQP